MGNRTSASSSVSGLAPVAGTFNPDDELASETYDSNGNVTATGGKTFAYDAENHLVSMGSTVALQYDGDGNRVAKSVSGVVTHYLVEDDVNPTGLPQVMEETVNGVLQREYTYGLQRISEYQPISGTWTPSFYGYDGGGNVRTLTNSAGAITDSYDYDAFGNKINSTGSTPNNYLYRGEAYDSDLGLYYLRARYYNPQSGRFLSRDPENGIPTDPDTLHKYNYAAGDPVNLADPTGRAQSRAGTAGGGLGEYAGLIGAAVSISLGYDSTHPGAVKALGQEIVCALEDIGSRDLATVEWGIDKGRGYDASIEQTDECHVQEKKRNCTLGGAIGAVVIGEGMRARIIPYAEKIGAGFYAGLPPEMSDFYMDDNERWIGEVMDQNCKILDGGSDGRPIHSPYYVMELQRIAARGYPKYPVPIAP